ncbi:hypothetical protein [Leifsonia aquatica]|uniref:hypothetical protein n=1 Tax=Leifsonia aquatica TaxID=144185 RepID=UPI0028AD35ED|nr:hypothetical protein [Leifsonia aquatica]
MERDSIFHFRDISVEQVLAEATEVAAAAGKDVRVGGGYSTARAFLRASLVSARAQRVLKTSHIIAEAIEHRA